LFNFSPASPKYSGSEGCGSLRSGLFSFICCHAYVSVIGLPSFFPASPKKCYVYEEGT
jgi:hypothetical protein